MTLSFPFALVFLAAIISFNDALAQHTKSMSMKEIEALHAKLDECESEYPAINPPSTLECLQVRGGLLAHYGSEDALKEASGMLKAAQAATKAWRSQQRGR